MVLNLCHSNGFTELGVVFRYKCRLVAQGFFQVQGQDYSDTYSPVCKFTSIRTLLAITAQLGLKVHAMDVDTAFLNAPINEDIWEQRKIDLE